MLGEDRQGDEPEEQDKHNTVQKHDDGRRQAALRAQAIQQPNHANMDHMAHGIRLYYDTYVPIRTTRKNGDQECELD
jgi:hypothetical protein